MATKATKSIKGITIEINGDTTKLGKALENVNKQSRSLQGELRDVDRALKLDPNNVTLVKQKQDILNESIKNTEEKLKTLKSVQSQVTAQLKSGEIGVEQYRNFQREIESSKKKLSELKSEKKNISVIGTEFAAVKEKITPVIGKIEKIGTTIGGVTTKTTKFTATLAKIDGKMISAAADGFKKYTAAVGGATAAVAGLAVSQASNLDQIDKQSQALGLSREAYQEWDYVLSQNGVDIESFGAGMKSLLTNMDKANEGSAAATANFQRLGVSVTNADGSLRSQEDVLKDTVAAFQRMEDGADKSRLATELFGRQGQALMPLLNGEAGSVEELTQKCHDLGMVVSDETVDAGVKFSDALDTLKRSGQGLFNTFASTGILTAFTDGIGEMTDGVSELLAAYNEGGIDGLTEKIPEVIDSLLGSVTEYIGSKAPELITTVTTVLTTIITSLATQAPGLINALLPPLLTGFTGLIQALVSTIPTLVPALVDGAVTLFLGLIDGLNAVIEQLMPMLPDIINKITATLVDNLPAIIEGGFQLLIGLIEGIANCTPQLIDAIVDLIPVITQAFSDNLPALVRAGMDLIVAVAEGLPEALPVLIAAIPGIFKAVVDAFAEQDWISIGKDVLGGGIDGLKEAIPAALSPVAEIGESIVDGFCDFFDINSPSRVMSKKVGRFLPPGIGEGMEETADVPIKKAQDIVNDVAGVTPDIDPVTINRKLNSTLSISGGETQAGEPAVGSALPETATFYMVVDGNVLAKASAPYLDVINGAAVRLSERGLS